MTGKSRKNVVIAVLLVGLLAMACVVAGIVVGVRSALELDRTVYVDPTDAELLAFAQQLAATLDGDGSAYAALYDAREMALRGVPETELAMRRGFVRGFASGGMQSEIFSALQAALASGGSYEFRGIAQRDGQAVVRFRLLFGGGGGVNFHDYLVKRDEEGQLRCVDLFAMVLGQYSSQAATDMIMSTTGAGQGTEVLRMQQAQQSGQPDRVLAEYEQLPENLRNTVLIQMLRVQAASELDDDAYLGILEDAMARVPDNVALTALSLDAYALRAQWPEVLNAVTKLNEAFPDPYWDVQAAHALMFTRDLDEAAARVARALAAEDDLTDAHEAAVMVAVDRNDVAAATREVLLLRDRFGYDRQRFVAWGAEDVLVNHPDLLALLPAP